MKKWDPYTVEKLNSLCFELLPTVFDWPVDKILSLLVDKLREILNVAEISIHMRCAGNEGFRQSTGYSSIPLAQLAVPADRAIRTNTINRIPYDPGTQQGAEMTMIPVLPNGSLELCLCLPTEKPHSERKQAFLLSMKQTVEAFFGMLHDRYKTNKENTRNKFLLQTTSQFYTMTSKQDLLTKIVSALESRYPSYSYHLLLSQDYETDETLPVKLIAFNDDTTRPISTHAFISGEIQLEDRAEEQQIHIHVPLAGEQAVYGVLELITPTTVSFSKEELDFLTKFANSAGKALENVALYRHSRRLAEDMKMINDVIHELNSNLNLPEITAIMKRDIMASCQAEEVGFIYLQTEEAEIERVLPNSTAFFNTEVGLTFTEQLAEKAAATKEAIFYGRFNDIPGLPCRSLMAIPMIQSGEIHGLVVIMHPKSYFFSFNTFKLMQSLVQHATLILANAVLKKQLETMIETDYLTNLYSRNYLDKTIQDHVDTADKGTLILFDIDDFKHVNDQFGHDVGDKVIKQVALVMRHHLNEQDIPARWGGEEFAIYAPDVSIDRGVRQAASIREQAKRQQQRSPRSLSPVVFQPGKGERGIRSRHYLFGRTGHYIKQKNTEKIV